MAHVRDLGPLGGQVRSDLPGLPSGFVWVVSPVCPLGRLTLPGPSGSAWLCLGPSGSAWACLEAFAESNLISLIWVWKSCLAWVCLGRLLLRTAALSMHHRSI